MKRKKRILILIIAVLIIIGSGVYLGTYYHAVDIENDLTTSDTVQVKDFDHGIFFDGPGITDALIFYPGAKVDTAAEYYGAAEPPVRCGESHLSGLTEPPQFVY